MSYGRIYGLPLLHSHLSPEMHFFSSRENERTNPIRLLSVPAPPQTHSEYYRNSMLTIIGLAKEWNGGRVAERDIRHLSRGESRRIWPALSLRKWRDFGRLLSRFCLLFRRSFTSALSLFHPVSSKSQSL